MNEAVTFSGQESKPLRLEDVLKAVASIHISKVASNWIHHINENCTEEQLRGLFRDYKLGTTTTIPAGLPVYKISYIPRGELWMMTEDGKVIKKFQLSN